MPSRSASSRSDDGRIDALLARDQVGPGRGPRGARSSTARATATSPTSPACRWRSGDAAAAALSDADVSRRQRRRRARRRGLAHDSRAAWTRPRRPASSASRAAARSSGRSAMPYEWRVNVTQLKNADGSAVDGTDARSLSRRRGRRPAPGRRLPALPARARARLRGRLRARDRAAARHPRDAAPGRRVRAERRRRHRLRRASPTSIGVNGWPLELHVAGDVEWRWPPIPESRGFNQLPLPDAAAARAIGAGGADQPARRRAAARR